MALKTPDFRKSTSADEAVEQPGKDPNRPNPAAEMPEPIPPPVRPGPITGEDDRPDPADVKPEPIPEPVRPPVVQGNKDVAVSRNQVPDLSASNEVEGFEGVDDDLGFGSFPIMKLDGKDFMCEGHVFDQVEGVLIRWADNFLFKARQGRDGEDVPVVYSADGEHTTGGRPLNDVFAEWVAVGEMEQGATPIRSRYKTVLFEVHNTGTDLDGEYVMCNVAPASVTRLAGYIKRLQIKRLAPQDVLTRLVPGSKVSMGRNSFHPWDFKYAGKLD